MKTEPLVLLNVLCFSFFLGIALGAWNDIWFFLAAVITDIKSKSRKKRIVFHKITQVIKDILFCFLAGFSLTVILFYYNEGRLRGFSLLGILFGFLGYRYTFGRLCKLFLPRLATAIGRCIYFVCYYLTVPLIRIFVWVFGLIKKPICRLQKKLLMRRIQRYHNACILKLKNISEKGFVNIEFGKNKIS